MVMEVIFFVFACAFLPCGFVSVVPFWMPLGWSVLLRALAEAVLFVLFWVFLAGFCFWELHPAETNKLKTKIVR